jgi:asparagine synthase (glutamine-hydrolysing)
MIEIKLTNNNGYEWKCIKNLYIKGIFENQNNIKDSLLQAKNKKDILNILNKIDTFFSFIIETQEVIFVAVDRICSIPIYYYIQKDKIIILDEPYKENFSKNNLLKENVDEFLNCGYVTSKETMIKNLYRLQAGEILLINKKDLSIDSYRYYEFRHKDFFDESQITFDNLYKMYENVFKKMINLLNGKTIVVPLSGGYDSRLIVYFLNKLNYENVICFSYGRKNNWESQISQQVAKYYGFKWIFIEYKKGEWFDIYQKEIENYMKFATNFANFAHTQDYLAVKKLKEKELIPKDSVIVPGHSGDFVAGSHIPYDIYDAKVININYIITSLLNKHYSLHKLSLKEKMFLFQDKILNIIKNKKNYTKEEIADEIEYLDWQERQVKYIVNSLKVYEYFGFSWYIPLWDREVMNFWQKIPLKYRIKRSFYIKFANSIHSQIKTNPKQNILKRAYERYCSEWYGRFIKGNCFKIFFLKLDDIFKDLTLPDYIDKNKKLYFFNRVSINVIKIYKSVKGLLK